MIKLLKEKSKSRSIRFPARLYHQLEAFADANNLSFTQAVNLLLNSAVQDPKLIKPGEIKAEK